MKKYLDNTAFTFNEVINKAFFSYSLQDLKRGEVQVKLSTNLNSAEIIHNDLQGNTYSYEVFNKKELQDTIEYILGKKVVSEDQWRLADSNGSGSLIAELEDWDTID